MGIWREHFHPYVWLRWEVLGWILGTAIAIAGLLLFFDQYIGANVCFALAAFFVFAKIGQVGLATDDALPSRLLFTFLLFGFVGAGIVETLRGVNHWAEKKEKRQAAASPASQPNEVAENAGPIKGGPKEPEAPPTSHKTNGQVHGTTDKVDAKSQRQLTKDKAGANSRNELAGEHVPSADEIAEALAKRLPPPGPAPTNPSSTPPFKFHEETPPDYYTITFPPGTSIRLGRDMLKKGWDGLANIDGERPFHIYEEDGDIYVDARVYDEQGNLVLKLEKSTIKNSLPNNWDVNYTDNAMEVVDAQQKPVFQMERDHPGFLRLNGRWYGKQGSYFGSAGPLKPLFKYPFRLHRGEYAQP